MHESEVTLKLAIPNFSLSTSTEAQKSIRHKKNRYFLQEEEFVDDFFRFWRLLGQLKKEKEDEQTRKQRGKIGKTKRNTKRKKKEKER